MNNINYTVTTLLTRRLGIAVLLLAVSMLSGCSNNIPDDELSGITIVAQGESIANRPEMTEACKGFYVSEQKLQDFFQYAANTHEQQTNDKAKSLPCYSSGLAYLAGEQYHWVLRSGGIAEFYNGEKSFTKICGISCCDNVQGVC